MTPQEIFLRASEIEAGSERAEYLDTACGDDVDLRAKVDSLLTTLESSDSNDGTEVGDDATVDRSNVATAGGHRYDTRGLRDPRRTGGAGQQLGAHA